MKKILFNDRYDLTKKVAEGRETQTRRLVKWDMLCDMREDSIARVRLTNTLADGRLVFTAFDLNSYPIGQAISPYRPGETVSVGQRYKDIFDDDGGMAAIPGWANKLFVRADLMPVHIRINDIKMELLQDISYEDCLKEGISEENTPTDTGYSFHETKANWETPREAFAALIDQISGKGTWARNPWVWVYGFEIED